MAVFEKCLPSSLPQAESKRRRSMALGEIASERCPDINGSYLLGLSLDPFSATLVKLVSCFEGIRHPPC